MPYQYTPAGSAITDEKVVFTEEEVIGVTTYYVAWLSNITDQTIEGSDSATYGVWASAGKAGQRYTVLLEGVPAANEVVWDIGSGKILCLTDTTLYARYLGYAQVNEFPQAVLHYPMQMVSGVTQDYIVRDVKRNMEITKYSIAVDGNISAQAVTLELRTAINGGGSGQDMSLGAGERTSGVQELGAAIMFTPDDKIVVHGDGKHISIVTITLW